MVITVRGYLGHIGTGASSYQQHPHNLKASAARVKGIAKMNEI